MKTRIKYIKKKNNGWYYAVQVKMLIFWKTIEIRGKELFGKECLEPMKIRITIEQIAE